MRVDQQDAGLPMVASKSFFDEAILLRWLVTGIFVAGQLAVIGGPPKSLKTSVAIDLALSLGTGTPFLGRFRVPHSLRVGLLSGESGKATIQETAKRICVAKGVKAEAADVRWGFDLPRLEEEQDLKKLTTTIVKRRLGAAIIDPLYLCAIGKSGLQASNVYEMGSLLGRVTRVCLDAGATPILIHHTKRNVHSSDGILDLGDLSFSGVAEAARQWLLLNRLSAFDPSSGQHHLRIVVGGSAGNCGRWDLEIDEGVAGGDLNGRTWKVVVQPCDLADSASERRPVGRRSKRQDRQ
jgi:RecA-family ATPase